MSGFPIENRLSSPSAVARGRARTREFNGRVSENPLALEGSPVVFELALQLPFRQPITLKDWGKVGVDGLVAVEIIEDHQSMANILGVHQKVVETPSLLVEIVVV